MRYHEIMLETAVPLPRWFFHATPQHKLSLIRQHGLTPSDESHPGQAAAVYLTHQMSLAQHYAEMNFGENDNQAWVILQIDASALDPARLKPDLGHETQMAMSDIVARGYTREQVLAGDFPWWISMAETGQLVI